MSFEASRGRTDKRDLSGDTMNPYLPLAHLEARTDNLRRAADGRRQRGAAVHALASKLSRGKDRKHVVLVPRHA